MDKLLVRKDVYEELLEKGFGKRDLSKLTKKKITDKNGHTRTVYVRNGEQPKRNRKSTDMETMIYEDMKQHVPGYETDDLMSKRVNNMNTIDEYEKLFSKMAANGINAKRDRPDLYEIYAAAKGNLRAINEELKARNNQRLNNAKQIGKKQSNVQEGLSDEKRAKYEKMLEKVVAGPEENALFVKDKGMLNKKEAVAHLSEKLGKHADEAMKNANAKANNLTSMSKDDKIAILSEYMHQKYSSVPVEEWKKTYNAKLSDKELDKAFKDFSETHQNRIKEYQKKKSVSSASQGHLEADEPQYTDITAEDEKRFGKEALSGLSGKRTNSEETKQTPKLGLKVGDTAYTKYGERAEIVEVDGEWVTAKMNGRTEKYKENAFKGKVENKPTQDDMKENYLDAKNEGGKDIADENRIDTHSKNAINLNDSEVKKMQKVFDYIPENANGNQIMNTIYDEDKNLYKKLSEMDIEYKKLHPEAEGKTFGFDLAAKYLEDSFNEYKKDHEVGKDKFAEMSVEDIRKEQQNLLDDYNQYYNAYKNGKNDGSKLREYFKKFDVYKTALDKKSKEK